MAHVDATSPMTHVDATSFLVTKISWRGRYERLLNLHLGSAVTTWTTDGATMTNGWPADALIGLDFRTSKEEELRVTLHLRRETWLGMHQVEELRLSMSSRSHHSQRLCAALNHMLLRAVPVTASAACWLETISAEAVASTVETVADVVVPEEVADPPPVARIVTENDAVEQDDDATPPDAKRAAACRRLRLSEVALLRNVTFAWRLQVLTSQDRTQPRTAQQAEAVKAAVGCAATGGPAPTAPAAPETESEVAVIEANAGVATAPLMPLPPAAEPSPESTSWSPTDQLSPLRPNAFGVERRADEAYWESLRWTSPPVKSPSMTSPSMTMMSPRTPPVSTPMVIEALSELRGEGAAQATARQLHQQLSQRDGFRAVPLPTVRKACSKLAKRDAKAAKNTLAEAAPVKPVESDADKENEAASEATSWSSAAAAIFSRW